MLRRGPLRTGRATFTASGSSKPTGQGPRGPWPCGEPWPPTSYDVHAVLPNMQQSVEVVALRSVHHSMAVVSNLTCPSVWLSLVTVAPHRPTWPRQPPFGSGHTPGIRPVIRHDRRRCRPSVPVSCRLSATGIRFLAIHIPLGNWAFLTVGLPAPVPRNRTPTGLPRCTRRETAGEGALCTPGTAVLITASCA